MYIGEKCGEVFEEPKVVGCDVDRGEECPCCGDEYFDEAYKCCVCGEYVSSDKIHGYDPYVCEDCINEHKYDLKTLLKATEDERADIEIPLLARYILTDEEIETLLLKELERRLKKTTDKFYPFPCFDTTDFLADYANDIADQIGKEVEGDQQ